MIQKATWFAFFAFLAFSCLNDPDCYNLNNNVIGISFRKMADDKADTVRLVRVEVNGADSIFYEFTLANGIQVPLNYRENQSLITLFLQTDTGIVEKTLELGYDSKIQFVSPDCGQRFVLGDLQALQHTFDSVRILNATPTSTPSTNMIVYRCPITNYMKVGFRQLFADEDSVGDLLPVIVETISGDYLPTPVYTQDTASTFKLPINSDAETTTFSFQFPEGAKTLTMRYALYDEALFIPCGIQNFFGSLSIDGTDFDNYELVNDTIQDPAVTNVIFYKCPETNLVKFTFKASGDENAPTASVTVTKVTADFSSQEFYPNATVSTMTLPLNTASNTTTYTFTFADNSVKEIVLNYNRTEAVYHEFCVQTEISGLEVASADFATPPEVVNTNTEFPAIDNVEIVND